MSCSAGSEASRAPRDLRPAGTGAQGAVSEGSAPWFSRSGQGRGAPSGTPARRVRVRLVTAGILAQPPALPHPGPAPPLRSVRWGGPNFEWGPGGRSEVVWGLAFKTPLSERLYVGVAQSLLTAPVLRALGRSEPHFPVSLGWLRVAGGSDTAGGAVLPRDFWRACRTLAMPAPQLSA